MIEVRNRKSVAQRKHDFFSSHRSSPGSKAQKHAPLLVLGSLASNSKKTILLAKPVAMTGNKKRLENFNLINYWLPLLSSVFMLLPKIAAESDIPELETLYLQEILTKNNYTIKGFYLTWFSNGMCNTTSLKAGQTYDKIATACDGARIYAGQGTLTNITSTVSCLLAAPKDKCDEDWLRSVIALCALGALVTLGVGGYIGSKVCKKENREAENQGTELYQML